MHKLLLSIILSICSICCMAQTSQSLRYYKDKYLTKETDKQHASFCETITKTADTITTELKDIKNDKVIRSESYKGEEPVGIWIIQSGGGALELNYNFTVIYSEDSCVNNFSGIIIKDYFSNNDTIAYVAPTSTNATSSINRFIMNRIIYPKNALRKGLQGTATILFTINTEGRIEYISARNGTSILFDKEAIRVIKLLAFSSPAMLHEKPISFCVTHKIKFNLAE